MNQLAKMISNEFKVTNQEQNAGIVYCLSKKETQDVAQVLREHNIHALHYHAGMDDHARLQHHRQWAAGKAQVIVATVAFGMGINKTTVRFVIHFTVGKSIETYYQAY